MGAAMKPTARLRLIEARKTKFRSAAAFAREIGLPRISVWQYEQGVRTPSLTVAVKMAAQLGRPVDELFASAGDSGPTA